MKKIKLFIELIFIFILPIVLIACCFNVKKEYDENNNEISKTLEFNNIFELSNENITYNKINYKYDSINDNDFGNLEEQVLIFSPLQYNNLGEYTFNIGSFQLIDLTDDTNNKQVYVYFQGITNEDPDLRLDMSFYVPEDEMEYYSSAYLDYDFELDLLIIYFDNILYSVFDTFDISDPSTIEIINDKFYYVDSVNSISISDNAISKVINYLYSSLGIQENYILQIIVIYTLLWLIMWFIWHLIYLPLDFLSGILIRKVDYE